MGKDRLMMLRTVRTGFLLLASLLAGRVPLPEDSSDTPTRSEWEHFNERCSSDSLKTLTPAEADFRANDEDWLRAEDFWTRDVRGLYTLSPQQKP
jgi:hypothetical protein